jgi:hypothetical protein
VQLKARGPARQLFRKLEKAFDDKDYDSAMLQREKRGSESPVGTRSRQATPKEEGCGQSQWQIR